MDSDVIRRRPPPHLQNFVVDLYSYFNDMWVHSFVLSGAPPRTHPRSCHATSLGISRSINRKNRCCEPPATIDSCDIGAGDPDGSPFAFWAAFSQRSGVAPPGFGPTPFTRGWIAHERRSWQTFTTGLREPGCSPIAKRGSCDSGMAGPPPPCQVLTPPC